MGALNVENQYMNNKDMVILHKAIQIAITHNGITSLYKKLSTIQKTDYFFHIVTFQTN